MTYADRDTFMEYALFFYVILRSESRRAIAALLESIERLLRVPLLSSEETWNRVCD